MEKLSKHVRNLQLFFGCLWTHVRLTIKILHQSVILLALTLGLQEIKNFVWLSYSFLFNSYLNIYSYLPNSATQLHDTFLQYLTHAFDFFNTAYETLGPAASTPRPYQALFTPAAPKQSYESLRPDATAPHPYQGLSTPSASAQPRHYDSHIAPPTSVPPANNSTYLEPANDPTYVEIEE